jgi:hypothetical protein
MKTPDDSVWIIVHVYHLPMGTVEHVGSDSFFRSEKEALDYIESRGRWIGAPSRDRMQVKRLERT